MQPTTRSRRKAPEPIACEFCGGMRQPKALLREDGTPYEIGGVPAFFGHEECNCQGATEAREAKAEEEAREKAEAKAKALAQAVENAGIPLRYREASHPWAAKMADDAANGQGFYITGPNGTGKTTLATAAALLLIEAGYKVTFMATYDLMDAMRSRKTEDRDVFDRAASCRVLVLDDLGKEASNTPYACERLFAIIDKRDKAMLPTIITSNFRLSEIAKNITEGSVGVAIASRLAASCKQVPLEGEDRRLKRGQD
ncbi:ATP-binding protein [Adlercreutzia sp.]|uniref:ATP-binding protein n=1 Tax=Adlercreutzia sp. TaxID=1872387 RepID=UPI003AB29F6D